MLGSLFALAPLAVFTASVNMKAGVRKCREVFTRGPCLYLWTFEYWRVVRGKPFVERTAWYCWRPVEYGLEGK
jgi:hypothetical protein